MQVPDDCIIQRKRGYSAEIYTPTQKWNHWNHHLDPLVAAKDLEIGQFARHEKWKWVGKAGFEHEQRPNAVLFGTHGDADVDDFWLG
ncbi:hypothetical protein DSL72_006870 [Monilinia vaccinii-corymbosi]|uniref:Uncharacterized protein n=1 Tax=Monilinia vaccinii-corymbosi TaxID=61207 RepID=A0A8A3PK95_9HELO|nr:hypothetical protein DSL72_006870 [Monilinia vaccinii-corymbosi]